jgi:hypothetical protein
MNVSSGFKRSMVLWTSEIRYSVVWALLLRRSNQGYLVATSIPIPLHSNAALNHMSTEVCLYGMAEDY